MFSCSFFIFEKFFLLDNNQNSLKRQGKKITMRLNSIVFFIWTMTSPFVSYLVL